ncbi:MULTISPECIES: hypothetical protein [unclassified Duganella]|jgi:hypothetical protein|uniref:hypothetical protein n=1 Tax=unclassified Duganella TaxID=2636909 RepID=UPI00088866C1|nr:MULTISPECIES: hypothetical protein [unclassified Duganella]SDG15463.1 hypothetical protein SAMN05216320_10374 [Duganella sp. OV458]SDJ32540.1 hypothetical protein SAMN05428973_103412 [Duganella sp. OV510]
MWQELIVALIVVVALVHFSTKYLPVAWRRRIVYTLGKRGFNEARLAKFFKTNGGGGCGSGCSDCGPSTTASSCDSKSTAPKQRVIKLHVQR